MEAMVAMVVLSLVLGATYVAIAQILSRNTRLYTDLEMSRLGRAVLVEYAVTWPAMSPTGVLGDTYRWQVEEVPLPSQGDVEQQLSIRYVQLNVEIEDLRGRVPPHVMSTAMVQSIK